jgi:hypothetical protein
MHKTTLLIEIWGIVNIAPPFMTSVNNELHASGRFSPDEKDCSTH